MAVISRLYDTYDMAQAAMTKLTAAGLRADDISIVSKDGHDRFQNHLIVPALNEHEPLDQMHQIGGGSGAESACVCAHQAGGDAGCHCERAGGGLPKLGDQEGYGFGQAEVGTGEGAV